VIHCVEKAIPVFSGEFDHTTNVMVVSQREPFRRINYATVWEVGGSVNRTVDGSPNMSSESFARHSNLNGM